jgi:predicted transcriptional regulator
LLIVSWEAPQMAKGLPHTSLGGTTSKIVSAYASYNQLAALELATLVRAVAGELRKVGLPPAEQERVRPEPVVPVQRSIASDHLVCLLCGKKRKLLKRHLAVEHGLSPAQYRDTFELKPDYPMAARNYAKQRRELALKIGLGRLRKPSAKPNKVGRRSRAPARAD